MVIHLICCRHTSISFIIYLQTCTQGSFTVLEKIRPSCCFCVLENRRILITSNLVLFFVLYSSANNSSPLSNSTPKKRLKSRWEPVLEEKVTDKVEPLTQPLMNGNAHNNREAKNRTVRTGMLLLKSSHQAVNTQDVLFFFTIGHRMDFCTVSILIYAISHACMFALVSSL